MVTAEAYVDGVEEIYIEQPDYESGHDGSDHLCDCIGMCRGGLERAGQTNVTNMRGTNQAARKTIRDLRQISSTDGLRVGDVVLKVRDKDDKSMPLPDRYRKGGADYDPVWGETNFTHIGTVTSLSPFTITHMTTPHPKKDKSLKGWTYAGSLPWVQYGEEPGPGPDPVPDPDPGTRFGIVWSENGRPVNMRRGPNIGAALVDRVPVGETVEIIGDRDDWDHINWDWKSGWMMERFIQEEKPEADYEVVIPNLTRAQAEASVAEYPGAYITVG